MSELQIGLLALGALAVAGVLAFNKWQEMRARRDGEKRFGSAHDDVLLGSAAAASHEGSASARTTARSTARSTASNTVNNTAGSTPHNAVDSAASSAANISAGELSAGHRSDGVAGRIEPVWHDAAVVSSAPVAADDEVEASPLAPRQPPSRTDLPPPVLDMRIDFIAELIVEEPLLGTHVMLEVEKFQRSRNVDVDGFNEAARAWEALDRDTVYENVRIGIQISDRSGPLRADELDIFQKSVSAVAQVFGGRVEWPADQNPLTRAAELDSFCAGVDVRIGINVVAGTAFAETKLRGLAEANGFARDDDGVFRRRDDVGAEVLTMKQASPEAVSFTLDVPRVPRDAAALALMAQCAKRFAAGIDGKLVDDQGKRLSDAGIAAIQTSLAAIYGRMEAAAMPAGGTIARRVFS